MGVAHGDTVQEDLGVLLDALTQAWDAQVSVGNEDGCPITEFEILSDSGKCHALHSCEATTNPAAWPSVTTKAAAP